MPVNERRQYVRYPAANASALFFNSHRAVFARLFDVSERGLGVRVHAPFDPGEVVGVKIDSRIHLRARVCWTTNSGQPGMGLEVIDFVQGEDEFEKLAQAANASAV